MPEKKVIDESREMKREGKAPTTQAGPFVREEMEHIRHGKHGARSTEQAIAIGLSKARRAGVKLPPPEKGAASETTRERAKHDLEVGAHATKKRPSAKRGRGVKKALRREPHTAASHAALSKHAKMVARKRGAAKRSAAAQKAVRTRKSHRAH